MDAPLKLVGGHGSPYSRKMRAVLRYRRIPFRWIRRGSAEDVGIPQVPVALIPVVVFPGKEGAGDEAMLGARGVGGSEQHGRRAGAPGHGGEPEAVALQGRLGVETLDAAIDDLPGALS